MSANVPKRIELEIPIAHDNELEATRVAEQLALEMHLGPECLAEIKLALVEGILNAFEHSGSSVPKVRIEFAVHDEELEVVVQDFGQGFDPSERPSLRPLQRRGYGRMLMESLMDDVKYFTSPQGTRLVMKKRLPKCA
ncbi:ATP-binding protein [Chloracidobacterium thermophilum]|uniref:ATP-binding protein n=1 Tax=Chloracidobacterium thermophilum TaxID=458033 RepID=UPI000738C25B|nr:ATP-binding protein [Chloracidobacterium thermophilum]